MLLQNVPNGDVGNLTQGKTNPSTMTMNTTMTIRSQFAFVGTALLLAASVSVSHAAVCSLNGLAWMAGNRHNATDPQP
jgi:hypothetical protein